MCRPLPPRAWTTIFAEGSNPGYAQDRGPFILRRKYASASTSYILASVWVYFSVSWCGGFSIFHLVKTTSHSWEASASFYKVKENWPPCFPLCRGSVKDKSERMILKQEADFWSSWGCYLRFEEVAFKMKVAISTWCQVEFYFGIFFSNCTIANWITVNDADTECPVVVTLYCGLDWIWDHQGDASQGMSGRVFLEMLVRGGKTHHERGQHWPMSWYPRLNKKKKSELGTSVHVSLLPDWRHNITNHPRPLLLRLPHQDALDLFKLWSKNKPFCP